MIHKRKEASLSLEGIVCEDYLIVSHASGVNLHKSSPNKLKTRLTVSVKVVVICAIVTGY